MYPRQIARMRVRVKDKTCFVIMPFSSEFDEVWAEINDTLTELGFECRRADDIFVSRAILQTVILEIKQSQLVIADLTNRNANVFYELGIAHMLKDVPSVLLISQNIAGLPFDVSHNLVIEYSSQNLRGLRVRLRKSILQNKAFLQGRMRLVDRYYYLSATDDFDRVLEFLDSRDESLWQLILAAFAFDERDELSNTEIYARFSDFAQALNEVIATGDLGLFRILNQIFIDTAIHLFSVPPVQQFIRVALARGSIEHLALDEQTMLSSMTDLAIASYRHPELKAESIHWILEYLRRPKVGGIDLNRSKAEAFVLATAKVDEDMKSSLMSALSDKHHLKEVAADAIGELHLTEAVPHLIVALEEERSNVYVARSIFAALGKIGAARGGPAILSWLRENAGWAMEVTTDVQRYAHRALGAIDAANGTTYRDEMDAMSPPVKHPKKARSRPPRKRQKSD